MCKGNAMLIQVVDIEMTTVNSGYTNSVYGYTTAYPLEVVPYIRRQY